MATKPKRRNNALEIRTFAGKDGQTYVVFRTTGGAFHTFVEVEAKEAARQCGDPPKGNTRSMWQSIWDGKS
ncbi:MAG TPA: hypothetical protein VFT57_17365 [Gemmatimonadaceae bacterium]|nr:hypothetical protein [Gemmatimonadaceae bacterium]